MLEPVYEFQIAPSQGEVQNNAKDQDKSEDPPLPLFVPEDQQTGAKDRQREPKNRTDDPC